MSPRGNRDRGTQHSGVFALSALRDSIELAFGRFGRSIFRNAWLTIACVSACTTALFTQLPYVTFDTSTENILRKGDPIRARYDDFRDRFGHDQMIMVAIETEDVFDLVFLEKLRALHREISANIP